MANITELRTRLTRQLGEQDGTYTDAYLTDYLNQAYDYVVSFIQNEINDTLWDDPNWGNVAIGYVDLVANQQSYSLVSDTDSADITDIYAVFAKQSISSDYTRVMRTNIQKSPEIADEDTGRSDRPYQYMYSGSNIIVYPKPSSNITNGLKYYYSRAQKAFETADTTVEPGFESMYHNLLPYYAATIIGGIEGKTTVVASNQSLFSSLATQFIKHLNNKNPDGVKVFKPRSKVIK